MKSKIEIGGILLEVQYTYAKAEPEVNFPETAYIEAVWINGVNACDFLDEFNPEWEDIIESKILEK